MNQILYTKKFRNGFDSASGNKNNFSNCLVENRKIQQQKPLPMQQKTFSVFSHRKRFFESLDLVNYSVKKFPLIKIFIPEFFRR